MVCITLRKVLEVFEKIIKSNLFTELTQNFFKVQTFPDEHKRRYCFVAFFCLVRSFSNSYFGVENPIETHRLFYAEKIGKHVIYILIVGNLRC